MTGRSHRTVCSVALIVSAAACSSSTPGAGDAVREVHAALAARDCPRLLAAIGGAAEREIRAIGCPQAFAEEERLGITVRGIDRVEPDGRHPETMLVTASLVAHGETRSVLYRVDRSGSRWVVTGGIGSSATALAAPPAPDTPSPTAPAAPAAPPPPGAPPADQLPPGAPPPPSEPPGPSARPPTPAPDPAIAAGQAKRGRELIDDAITRTEAELAAARAAADPDPARIHALEIRLTRLQHSQPQQ
jgi:hypothetical protein